MVDAAAAFVRIKIKVPEAYLLLHPLSTSRPALLVLDADTRRIHSIKLPAKPKAIADELDLVEDLDPVELFRVAIQGENAEAFRDAVDEFDAVEDTDLRGGFFRINVTQGELEPMALEALARKHKVGLRWHNPVPVTLLANAKKDAPGIWYTSRDRAFIANLLLDPKALAAVTADLEARVFELPDIPKGGGGARVAAAPIKVPGVLSVFPDIFGDKELVVARKGSILWKDVLEAFAKTGVQAKAKR